MRTFIILVLAMLPFIAAAQKIALDTHGVAFHCSAIIKDSVESAYDGTIRMYPDGKVVWEQKGRDAYNLSVKAKRGDWKDMSAKGREEFDVEREGRETQLAVEKTDAGLRINVQIKTRHDQVHTFQLVVDKVDVL